MSGLRVVFLGTSSGKPTLSRGVAAVAVVLEGTLVLFDCGEGTQIQFIKAGLRHSRLKVTCVSHFHGDHINGLPGLLGTMTLDGHESPVTVVGPKGLKEYLRVLRRLGVIVPRFPLEIMELGRDRWAYHSHLFRILSERLDHRIETWGFRFEESDRPGRFDVEAARALGVPRGPLYGELQHGTPITLEDGRVVHPHQVLGEKRPGRTVAYLSDTRPCEAGIRLAQGVDLLIHEGTYDPTLGDRARERGHSTVVQAAEVAQQANVKQLAITHISPKYIEFQPLLAAAREVFENTIIARDLMEIEIPATG